MATFAFLEVHSQNELPGSDILSNREQFRLKIETPPTNKFRRKKRSPTCFYLFICPIFLHSSDPLTSLPKTSAPFCIESLFLKIKPAYLVYKGEVHLGIQLQKMPRELDILVRLAVRTPKSIDQSYRYELAQILLFDNSGSLAPADVKTIVISHDPKDLAVINTGDVPRAPITTPLPYFQSPQLQNLDEDPLEPSTNPTMINLGDMDNVYAGLHDFLPFRQAPILGELYAFPPLISYPAKLYFAPLFPNKNYWFSPHFIATLMNDTTRFLHSLPLVYYNTQSTQTDTITNDATSQTEIEEDSELNAILDDLLSTLPPSPPTTSPQVQLYCQSYLLIQVEV